MLPTYYLAKFTKQFVTVALNGDAGDENFAGYGRYKVYQKSLIFNKIPRWLRRFGRAVLKFIKKRVYSNSFIMNVIKFIDSLDADEIEKYIRYIGYFTDKEKREMLEPDFLNNLSNSSLFLKSVSDKAKKYNWLDRILYTDFNSYLPDDLMTKVDIATMKVSLESRAPLLDRNFVELMAKIPPELKLKSGESKYILKKALRGILPDEILYRKKMGFGVPAGEWFRGELKNYYRKTVIEDSSFVSQIIKKEYLEKLFAENIAVGGEGRKLWLLLCLELWYRAYFKS